MVFFKGYVNNESDEDKLERLSKERRELENSILVSEKIKAEEEKIKLLKRKRGNKVVGDTLGWLGDYAKDIKKNFEGDDKK
jgi:hypothetical protein